MISAGDARDRARGAMLGLAIGDALGMPFENMDAEAIREKGPVDRFFDAPVSYLKAGQWTDDTKMAVHLALGILDGEGIFDPEFVARRYMEWFDSGDLRGIGAATREALGRLKKGASWIESGKRGDFAAGNGTAMRCAPIGIFRRGDPVALKTDAARDAIITHNNPEAVAGSRAVACAVAMGINQQVDIKSDPMGFLDCIRDFIGESLLNQRLKLAGELLAQGRDAEFALKQLGTSGWLVETVASAVFCVLKFPDDFESAVVSAVMGGDDADTTGAVTGAISGAFIGAAGIPAKFAENVEAKDMLITLADKLFDVSAL